MDIEEDKWTSYREVAAALRDNDASGASRAGGGSAMSAPIGIGNPAP